ncbi:unnamed protein product, partial [Rotaria sp. Silwood1]
CVHPTNHQGAAKIGSNPTHPRGDRKVDSKLARFINELYQTSIGGNTSSIQEGDYLCRTCYEKERLKRKTAIIQQQVTKAIHLIRLAADEIITSPRTASKDLAKTVLTIDDTEQLLDDLKLLFRTSEYDEQQARKALELRESFGFLAKVTHFAGNFPIDPEIVKEIKNFYQDDGVTRQTSNKKEQQRTNLYTRMNILSVKLCINHFDT